MKPQGEPLPLLLKIYIIRYHGLKCRQQRRLKNPAVYHHPGVYGGGREAFGFSTPELSLKVFEEEEKPLLPGKKID